MIKIVNHMLDFHYIHMKYIFMSDDPKKSINAKTECIHEWDHTSIIAEVNESVKQ